MRGCGPEFLGCTMAFICGGFFWAMYKGECACPIFVIKLLLGCAGWVSIAHSHWVFLLCRGGLGKAPWSLSVFFLLLW